MRGDLGECVLAAARPDLQPQGAHPWPESRQRRGGVLGAERKARQREVKQAPLARAERMATRPAIEPVGRRLDV